MMGGGGSLMSSHCLNVVCVYQFTVIINKLHTQMSESKQAKKAKKKKKRRWGHKQKIAQHTQKMLVRPSPG